MRKFSRAQLFKHAKPTALADKFTRSPYLVFSLRACDLYKANLKYRSVAVLFLQIDGAKFYVFNGLKVEVLTFGRKEIYDFLSLSRCFINEAQMRMR